MYNTVEIPKLFTRAAYQLVVVQVVHLACCGLLVQVVEYYYYYMYKYKYDIKIFASHILFYVFWNPREEKSLLYFRYLYQYEYKNHLMCISPVKHDSTSYK